MAMRNGGGRGGLKADINMAPLAAVMFVLLINMMLITPIVCGGAALQMPEAANAGQKPNKEDQTVVAIDSRGMFYVNAVPVSSDNLVPHVQRVLDGKKDKVVYLKGDKDARYSAVMDAMDAFRKVQIEGIVLVTEKKN